jgi:hypothetical protein
VHRFISVRDTYDVNYRILELGSQIGSIPSWLGGKIHFWVEFCRATWAQFHFYLGQIELGNKLLEKCFVCMIQYVIYVVFIIQYIIYIMLPILNFVEP